MIYLQMSEQVLMHVLMYHHAVLSFLHWGHPVIRKKTLVEKILKENKSHDFLTRYNKNTISGKLTRIP